MAAGECSAAWSLAYRDAAAAGARLASGEQALRALRPPSFVAVTDCLRARARMLEVQGDIDGAIRVLEEGLPQLPPSNRDTWVRLSMLQVQLSDFYRRVDRYADALRISEESLADLRRRGQAGTLSEFAGLNNVAGNLAQMGEVHAAHVIYRDLLTWLDRGVFSVQPLALQANVGFSEMRMGNPAEALRLAESERAADQRAGNAFQIALADFLGRERCWHWAAPRKRARDWTPPRPFSGRTPAPAPMRDSSPRSVCTGQRSWPPRAG